MRSKRTFGACCLAGALLAGGCDRLAARMEFKQGNSEYRNESYRTAIAAYEKGLALDPDAKQVWRSLGLAAMTLYRPGDPAPANLAYAKRAVEAFENYLAAYPADEKVREYLLTTLLNSEQYDAALERLEEAARSHPDDPRLEDGIVSVLLRARRLEDAVARVRRQGAEASYASVYAIGVYCWDKAYRDPLLDAPTRSAIVEIGISMLRRAVELQPQAFESNVYLNLILREKVKLEPDPEVQQTILAEAMVYQEKAKAIAQAKKKSPAA